MEAIRSIVYTLAFVSVISEIAVYLISEPKYKRIIRTITAAFSVFCIMSCFDLADISNINFDVFFQNCKEDAAYYSEEEIDNIIKDKQTELLKSQIEEKLEEILSEYQIVTKRINVILNGDGGEIDSVICEVYIVESQRNFFETNSDKICADFDFEIRDYYVEDDE